MATNAYQPMMSSYLGRLLEYRSQLMEEQEFKLKMQQAMANQALQVSRDIGGALVGAAQTGQKNRFTNQAMNELLPQPPRAQAVDKSQQVAADIKAQSMPGFYQGGTAELEARSKVTDLSNKMDDQKLQRIGAMATVLRLGQAQERENRLKSQWEISRADTLRQRMSQGAKSAFDDYLGYTKNHRVMMEAIGNAETPETYQDAVDALQGMYQGARKGGVDVPVPNIPPFMSPEDKRLLADKQRILKAAEQTYQGRTSDTIPDMFGGDASAKAAREAAQKEVEAIKGKGIQAPQIKEEPLGQGPGPTNQQAVTGSPMGQAGTGGTGAWMKDPKTGQLYPPGTKLTKKDGTRAVWTGFGFEPIKEDEE